MKLQEYDYTVVYKSGKTHLEPDSLLPSQPLQSGESDGNIDAFIFTLKFGSGLAEENDKDPTLSQF